MPGKNRSMQKKMAKKSSGSNAKSITKAMGRLDKIIAAKKKAKKAKRK